jgi:hypothetical protein
MTDDSLPASPVTLSYNIHKGASIHKHMGDVQDNANIRGVWFLKILRYVEMHNSGTSNTAACSRHQVVSSNKNL